MSYTPNAEHAMVAWISSLFSSRCDVSADVPDTAWGSKDLLVTVAQIVANHDHYSTLRSADVQVDIWGRAASGAGGAPINKVSALAEDIHDATISTGRIVLAGPTVAYRDVRVTSLESEGFDRIPDDEQASIAHFRGTVTIVYVPVD
jgi:hypothetical protein